MELLLVRVLLVLHNVVALPLSQRFNLCLSRCIAYQIPSLVTLVPVFAYALIFVLYNVFWNSPLQSWHQLPNMFIFLAVQCCVTIIALQTALMETFLNKVHKLTQRKKWLIYCWFLCICLKARQINALLDCAPKHLFELESILTAAAKERALLNEEVANLIGKIGPMVFITAITLCIRLSFVIFGNFSATLTMYQNPSTFTISLLFLYARAVTKVILLVRVSNSGQCLKDEVLCKMTCQTKKY